jgi:hypothetical protein
MTWASIRDLIFQQRQLLNTTATVEFPQESVFETQSSAFLASYLQTQSRVDAVVGYFARRLEWPETTLLEKCFILGRLDFAWEVASSLDSDNATIPIACPDIDKSKTAELLEWLLVDVWPYGCSRFLATQNSMPDRPIWPEREESNQESKMPEVESVSCEVGQCPLNAPY